MLTTIWRPVRMLATCLSAMALSSGAQAGYIYTYQGNTYTDVSGATPQVTTSDSVTGFVEFMTLPTAGGFLSTGYLIAYALNDGARSLSSAHDDDLFNFGSYFTFDSDLNILTWSFALIPDGAASGADAIYTRNDYDVTNVGAGFVSRGIARPGGTWTRQFAVNTVPEPGTLGLALVPLAALTLRVRPRRKN